MATSSSPEAQALAVPTQDLEAHHAPIQSELEAAALRAIRSGHYILGPEVKAFEKEAAEVSGVAHAVGVSSGTDALLATLMALGVGPGDEVVTTPFSFFATVGAIVRLGARPVFADVDPDTMNLDDAKAADKVRPQTKAVLTVHLFGRMARTALLARACEATGVPIVEDAAQAIGAEETGSGGGRRVGQVGRAAALSFFPSKNLGGCGDGGMVLTNDAALAEAVRLVRGHGARPKYHHLVVGGNFRLDELQAALLRVKLPHLQEWSAARRRLAAMYSEQLAGLPIALPPADAGCVWNQYVIRVKHGRREALARALQADGIATAVYYPEPLHVQPCFRGLGFEEGDFPEAEAAAREALALPMYPELPPSSLSRVCESLKRHLS